jgi:hypothetical protein
MVAIGNIQNPSYGEHYYAYAVKDLKESEKDGPFRKAL